MTKRSLPPKVCVDQLEEVIDAQEAEFYALQRAMKAQQAEHARTIQCMEDKVHALYLQLFDQRSKLRGVLTTALDGLDSPQRCTSGRKRHRSEYEVDGETDHTFICG